MCHTQTQVDQPLTTAGSAAPGGGTAGAGPVNGDPLSSAIQAEAAAQPKTASVTQPTKFAKLLSFVAPLAEGALVGGFSGRSHPDGGFGAASDHFARKRHEDLQRKLFAQNQVNQGITNQLHSDQAAYDRARTLHEIGKPEYANSRTWTTKDGVFRANPQTGDPERLGDVPDKPEKNQFITNEDGVFAGNPDEATVRPVTIGGAPPQSSPVGPNPVGPGKFGGATASPSLIRSGTGRLPTTAPGAGQQLKGKKPAEKTPNDFEQFYQQFRDDNGLDDSAKNRLRARAMYSAAERKPDKEKTDEISPAQKSRLQTHYRDQLHRDLDASEKQRLKDLKDAGYDSTPEIKNEADAETVKKIEDANADRKQRAHEDVASAAELAGVDIGDVPDYHAPLVSGRSPVPQSAPPSQPSKVVTPDIVSAWAKKQGISVPAAQKQFKAKGYQVAIQ